MNNDVYKVPNSTLEITKTKNELQLTLRIATRQKALIYSFLSYLILAAITTQISPEYKIYFQFLIIPIFLAIAVSTARLSWLLYSSMVAAPLIILSIIPLINLIVLLIINYSANRKIKDDGFMGLTQKKLIIK